MKEGSPPRLNSFFINIPAAGKDPTSCQHARQQARFCDRLGNKTTKRMMYDLFADFYEKSSDSQPKYKVLLSSIHPSRIGEMEELGFKEDKESTPGFLDYVMESSADEVQDWVQNGYVGELLDVIDCGIHFQRITIQAMEVEVIDDGHYPPRGLMIDDTFVSFEYSDLNSPVFFEDRTPEPDGGHGLWFQVPMKHLKRYFKCLTMMEVMEGLKRFGGRMRWTFNQLRRYFAAGIDEAVEIATQVFAGERDLDGKSALLHALAVGMAGKTDDEKIVGFLHDVVEDSKWEVEDLMREGFSEEVTRAVAILTHEKWHETYEQNIDRIVRSGNKLAINVKINDLKHNIERGQKGRHKKLVKKHEDALAALLDYKEGKAHVIKKER